MTGTLAEELSRSLLEAERTRTPIPPLSDSHLDLTERDAYRIQDALVDARGEPRVGYKLGFTSEAMREQMGILGPNYGQLTSEQQVDREAPVEPWPGGRTKPNGRRR